MQNIKLWSARESAFLKKFNTPPKIQALLDDIPYNAVGDCKSPRNVLLKRTAHCFEGALLAAAVFQFHGREPLVVDLVAENDDDHVIAVFQYKNHWGAVAKSNCTTLRFREPVYRNLRELVMSYFDVYLNLNGEKSLRSYSRPVNINWLHSRDWIITDHDLEPLGYKLFDYRHYPILSKTMIRNLSPAGKMLLKATLLDSNPSGLYKPKK